MAFFSPVLFAHATDITASGIDDAVENLHHLRSFSSLHAPRALLRPKTTRSCRMRCYLRASLIDELTTWASRNTWQHAPVRRFPVQSASLQATFMFPSRQSVWGTVGALIRRLLRVCMVWEQGTCKRKTSC